MKQILQITFVLCLAVLCGCGEKNQQEKDLLPASRETFVYTEIEEADCMTVDEDGLLYISVWQQPEDKGPIPVTEYVYQPDKQQISVYDLDGNCIRQETVAFGNGMCGTMLVQGKTMYCTVFHSDYNCPVLFAIDTETWEVAEAAKLKGYSSISYLIPMGDYFYVLGRYKEAFDKEYTDDQAQTYRYNRIGRINTAAEEARLEMMNVELPVAMYRTTKDTLMIYRYGDGMGFGFLEFDQMAGTLTEAGWKKTDRLITNIGGCGDGYLCTQSLDTLYYGTADGKEAQVFPGSVILNRPPVYQKGFAFFRNRENEQVYRICVEDILQENQPLQFLLAEMAQDLPYGCGFQMEKKIVTDEELALKVLALDKDFDLFLLSTRTQISDSIRKNGVFYALNDVDGVEEYLNACFPYLNELARNEEGDIWMVPVMLAIPGVVYNKEYCAEQGVDLSSMDFEEFIAFTEKGREENPDYVSISGYVCREELFGQYLSKYDTFDSELFRHYAAVLKKVSGKNWLFSGAMEDSLSYTGDISWAMEEEYPLQTKGELPEFYYFYNVYSRVLEGLQENFRSREDVGMIGVPKLAEGIGNYGTLTFLAVNPQSENLEATLEYISAFAKYMLTKQDSFLLADESTYTDTPFTKDWYNLYANGTVYFGVEGDVFLSTFGDYLEDTIDLETAIVEMERRRKLYLEE